jgi:hypothetical protein
MMKWCFSFILLIACAKASAVETSVEFWRGDYDQAFQDSQYSLGAKFVLPNPKYKVFGGYAYTDRNYREMAHVYKNAFTLGGSIEFTKWQSYLELSAMTSDTDLMGALNRYTVVPHTTALKDFDLGLAFDLSNYSTGDVLSISPQILYFVNDNLILGYTSWSFKDEMDWHYAWRVFVRAKQEHWSEEISAAGGETKEDIGVIDTYSTVGGSIKYLHKRFTSGILLERYDGQLRRGWQGGLQITCPF